MLQRLPTALPQVKACNAPKNLLNEIRQILYSLYCAKEITKTLYNNIMDMDMYLWICINGYVLWICIMDMYYGYVLWICIVDMYYGYAFMDMY